jgi:hypothetical protein
MQMKEDAQLNYVNNEGMTPYVPFVKKSISMLLLCAALLDVSSLHSSVCV